MPVFSILPKPILPGLTNGQLVLATLQRHRHTTFSVALNRRNARDVDDGAAMNLPERLIVEFIE